MQKLWLSFPNCNYYHKDKSVFKIFYFSLIFQQTIFKKKTKNATYSQKWISSTIMGLIKRICMCWSTSPWYSISSFLSTCPLQRPCLWREESNAPTSGGSSLPISVFASFSVNSEEHHQTARKGKSLPIDHRIEDSEECLMAERTHHGQMLQIR